MDLEKGRSIKIWRVIYKALPTPPTHTELKHTFDVLKITNRSISFRLAPPRNSSTVEGCLEEREESTSLHMKMANQQFMLVEKSK